MNTRSTYQFLRIALGFVFLCGMVLGDFNPASATLTCYVKWNATGSNTGDSWTNAFLDLQDALDSVPCTEVWVAAGTYRPTSGTDRTVSFVLKSGVAIYGGFEGGETQLSQRNPASNLTTLSGNIGVSGNSDNSYHVVVGSETNSTSVLDGFTIMAGNATGSNWPEGVGGGMYSNNGSPTLANIVFSGNSTGTDGGGLYNQNSSPKLTNVTFRDNTAAFGGGMYNWQQSRPRLLNVTFSGNSASSDGGGMRNNESSPILTNVTFSGNSAGTFGGGMFNWWGSSPSLMNVTFNGNSAPNGGGISNYNSSNPTVKNSILFGDTGGEIYNNNSSPTVTYSIIHGGYVGTGNLNADPLLKPLGNYGGFTQTMALGRGSPAIDKGTNTGCPPKDQRGVARPKDGDGNGTTTCDMGATESRYLTGTFQSGAIQDGWVLESSETSEVGGMMNNNQESISVGDYSAAKKQARGILSFNTASLPDNAIITKATLSVKEAGMVGANPFLTLGYLSVDVRKGAYSNNAALQLGDFQAAASKNAVMTIPNNSVSGWYSAALASANLGYINKKGLTQFRLRFTMDDNDDTLSNYIRFYSGNCPVIDKCFAADRPKLIINYYIP